MIGSTKKLINEPENLVQESLIGLIKSHSHLNLIEGYNIVVRNDIEKIRDHKVTLISGGGSGHEPAHSLYVGKGMLSAAVCGNVFTSPSVDAIYQAIITCTTAKGPGCLLIVKNYTGDVLNFGLAQELAKQKGLNVKMVIVGDDVALLDKKTVGRRGIAGTIFVHKIAGALSEKGASLDKVFEVCKKISESISTMGVGLGPCIIPGNKEASFQLKDDEIEIGLGIHGEAGAKKVKMEKADLVIDQIFNYLLKSDVYKKGNKVCVMINNLGGITNLENYIVAKRSLEILENKEILVKRIYVGSFMTALEMAGVSISLLKLDENENEVLELLDLETQSPAWHLSQKVESKKILIKPSIQEKEIYEKKETEESKYFEKLLKLLANEAIKNEDYLCELDSKCGDGDFGNNFARAGKYILNNISNLPLYDYSKSLYEISLLVQKIGGTSGVVFGLFLLKLSQYLQGKDQVTSKDWLEGFKFGIQGVTNLSGAKKGDRTFLDSLIPAIETLEYEITKGFDFNHSPNAIYESAKKGCDDTKNMLPKKGRGTYLGDRILGSADPGSKAIELLFQVWSSHK